MIAQVIVYTQAGPIIGKANEITQEEVDDLKESLKSIAPKINYLDLDTDRGWVIVPGPSVQFVELVVEG